MHTIHAGMVGSILAVSPALYAQCTVANQVSVSVVDGSGAAVPAKVRLNAGMEQATDASGNLLLTCVPAGSYTLLVHAPSFEDREMHQIKQAAAADSVKVQLSAAAVATAIQVTAESEASASALEKAGTLKADQLKSLANDPDEFRRQLLARVAAGNAQQNVIISVDGFQETSTLPPKDSIVSVRTNPNPYTAELQYPVVDGGRLEVTTKPGTPTFHGSVFFNSSSSSFNASDAYSLVPLSEELKIVQSYLALQQIRFADRLQVRFNTSPELMQTLVPNFLLQPLVENAVHHGISPLRQGGTIETTICQQDSMLCFRVHDNGSGKGNAAIPGHGIGLSNLRDRLEHFYPGRHRFEARPGTSGGFEVTIAIPMEYSRA